MDYCIVTDRGLCYTTYDEWIRKNFGWYMTFFKYNHDIDDIEYDRLYKIIGHAPHKDGSIIFGSISNSGSSDSPFGATNLSSSSCL